MSGLDDLITKAEAAKAHQDQRNQSADLLDKMDPEFPASRPPKVIGELADAVIELADENRRLRDAWSSLKEWADTSSDEPKADVSEAIRFLESEHGIES